MNNKKNLTLQYYLSFGIIFLFIHWCT